MQPAFNRFFVNSDKLAIVAASVLITASIEFGYKRVQDRFRFTVPETADWRKALNREYVAFTEE